ncbi:MAG: PorP/SprF family type IX secretion system membrane protein [Paludibacteraceae bacterium]|nr:PorP/SprF family type IX secretion system membrane protein [Paludibacteraceae bacterium]
MKQSSMTAGVNSFRYIYMLLVCALLSVSCIAQEDVLFTNKQMRMPYYNPAYIPELLEATITVGGRNQWTGIEGAPKTIMVSGKYFFVGAHSQVSLSYMADKIGYQYTLQPKLQYAFMVPFADDCYLNLGVGGGFVKRGYHPEMIDPVNTINDATIEDKLIESRQPDAEAGFELLIQNFELGASVNHLIKGNSERPMTKFYSAYANYLFQTKEWWRLTASYSLYNYHEMNYGQRWKHQLSVYFQYLWDYEAKPKDLVYLGLAFRPTLEGSIMGGINLFSFLNVFYSYDCFFGNLRYTSKGTHEIGLEFKIPHKFKGCYANYGKSHKYTRYTRIK